MYLISNALTTFELLRKTYKDISNPFNEGCKINWKNFFKTDTSKRNLTFEYLNELKTK